MDQTLPPVSAPQTPTEHCHSAAAPRWMGRAFASALLGLALLPALHTKGQLFIAAWLPLLLFIAIPAALLRKRQGSDDERFSRLAPRLWPLIVLSGATVLLLFSSATRHKWFFFLGWAPESATFTRTGLGRFLLLSVLLLPLCARPGRRSAFTLWALLFAAQVACFISLWRGTDGGATLWRDDHPSFIFRIHEYTRIFPRLQSYNPWWNGGGPHAVGVTSGILGPFLLAAPLWFVAPVHQVYTAAVGWIFILAVPWIIAASIRAMGGDRSTAAIAGILALGVSQHFFLWMLHFGTIGATLSATMLPAVAALSYRAVHLRRLSWKGGLALVVVCLLMLGWPPGLLFGVGMVLALVLSFRRWSWRLWGFLGACGVTVALIWAPILRVLLGHGGGTVDYVMDGAACATPAASGFRHIFVEGVTHLKYHVLEANPLLILFGLVGTFTASPGRIRRWFGPTLVVLAFLTGWGPSLLPRLQLGRTAIPLFLATVPPAALLLGRIWRAMDSRLAIARAALLALLVLGAWNVAKIYAGHGLTPYSVFHDTPGGLADAIRAHTPPDTRVLFAGRTVHAYGRGHVAYLPILTGREMMACDYYHFPIDMVEYEYPPRPWRESLEGFRAFCEIYNIGLAVTYHDSWKDYFRSNSDFFEEAFAWNDIAGYRLRRDPSPIYGARGLVRADFNRIEVELETAAEDIVLPYNWCEGLETSGDVEIFPVSRGEGIVLIGVRPREKRKITIRWRSPPPLRRKQDLLGQ